MVEKEPNGNKIKTLPKFLYSLDTPQVIQKHLDTSKYSKLSSIIRLRSAGLPTLPGFVVNNLTQDVLSYLRDWNAKHKFERFSLRFDSPNPEDHIKLQGSNPTIEELANMVPIFKPPLIGIVMAENDRFNQMHSVLTLFSKDSLLLEIVGPGFDAADLTRGNPSPQEKNLKHKTRGQLFLKEKSF